jgi:4-hydroxy-tetrahydrodipicolinate reductase
MRNLSHLLTKSVEVELLSPESDLDTKINGLKAQCEADGKTLIVIDFTLPFAVNPNAKVYAKYSLPFVMGTTGGDREMLMADTVAADIYAVIAPNMCKQIVALQV